MKCGFQFACKVSLDVEVKCQVERGLVQRLQSRRNDLEAELSQLVSVRPPPVHGVYSDPCTLHVHAVSSGERSLYMGCTVTHVHCVFMLCPVVTAPCTWAVQ